MEIINENYILLNLEFEENKRFSVNDFRSSLMGIKSEIKNIKQNKIQIHNVPFEINKSFIQGIKKKYKEDLDNKTNYLYPIDFSIIKRVIQTIQVSGRTRYTNIPAGVMVLYKYIGPLTYITDFLNLFKTIINTWKDNENNIFNAITNLKIILGSEIEYIDEFINQDYFLLCFTFTSEKADPNDFRRALLGLTRRSKGKEIPFNPNAPELIKRSFLRRIEEDYGEKLDSKASYIYPIDFAIIKRPITYNTKNGGRKSDFAAGIFLLYKYVGPLTYIKEFKEILKINFMKLRNETEYEFKNSYFNKANDPVIIAGADLKYYKGL